MWEKAQIELDSDLLGPSARIIPIA